MGLREDLGGKLEEALNKLVDEHLSAEKLTPMITGLLEGQVEKLKQMLKADVIDKIDGEDDIK